MKFIIYIFLLALPFAGFTQTTNFAIKASVGHLNSPAKAYLRYAVNDKTIIDSSTIKNGEFEIKGLINEPVRAVLFINTKGNGLNGSDDYTSLYVGKGTTLVNSPDSVGHAKISGTKISEEYAKFSLMNEETFKEDNAVENMVSKASPALKATAEFQNKVDSLNELAQTHECGALISFIKENPSSVVSLAALSTYDYYADFKDIEPLYHSLTPEVQESETGKKYATRLAILKTVSIGNPAPQFSATDTNGHLIPLSSFKGKYVLLDFWASWCVPCRQENPNVVNAYREYKNKNFTVLGYSLDVLKEKAAWIKAIQTDGLVWTQVSDLTISGNQVGKNRVAELYGVRAIPSNFLIGPDGRIVAKSLHGAQLQKKLATLLN